MPVWELTHEKYISHDRSSQCGISFLATRQVIFYPQIGGFEQLTLDVEDELDKLVQLMFKLKIHIISELSFNDNIELATGNGWKSEAKAEFLNGVALFTIKNIYLTTETVIINCFNEKDLNFLAQILFQNVFLCSMRCTVAREMVKVIDNFANKHSSAQKLLSYIKNFSKCKGRAQEDIIEKTIGKGNANDMIQNIIIVKLEKENSLIVSYVQCGIIAQLFETIKELNLQLT